MTEDKLSIRVELEGRVLEDFLRIKEERNFELNTETIRYCITETANSGNFSLTDEYIQHIRKLMRNETVRKRYSIYHPEDFIRKAIDKFVEEIQKGIESIQSFDVRSGLNDEENDYALAIIELQDRSPNKMISAESLAEYMGQRNISKIREVLEDFADRSLISKMVYRGKIYYHAKP